MFSNIWAKDYADAVMSMKQGLIERFEGRGCHSSCIVAHHITVTLTTDPIQWKQYFDLF